MKQLLILVVTLSSLGLQAQFKKLDKYPSSDFFNLEITDSYVAVGGTSVSVRHVDYGSAELNAIKKLCEVFCGTISRSERDVSGNFKSETLPIHIRYYNCPVVRNYEVVKRDYGYNKKSDTYLTAVKIKLEL